MNKIFITIIFLACVSSIQAQSDSPAKNAGTSFLKVHLNNSSRWLKAGATRTLPFSDGTNLSFRAIQAADIPSLSATYFALGGNTATDPTIGTNNVEPLHIETGGTRRLSIPSSGIANTPASTKALVLSSNDSLQYKTLQSDAFTATVTQSGSDTLLNTATCYGHFTRVGDVVTVTVRIELAVTISGAVNNVYFSPPIASNFTSATSDVIGVGNMETQGALGGDIPHQRCLVFADTSTDKIAISFDPAAALVYPANRQFISISASYPVQ